MSAIPVGTNEGGNGHGNRSIGLFTKFVRLTNPAALLRIEIRQQWLSVATGQLIRLQYVSTNGSSAITKHFVFYMIHSKRSFSAHRKQQNSPLDQHAYGTAIQPN